MLGETLKELNHLGDIGIHIKPSSLCSPYCYGMIMKLTSWGRLWFKLASSPQNLQSCNHVVGVAPFQSLPHEPQAMKCNVLWVLGCSCRTDERLLQSEVIKIIPITIKFRVFAAAFFGVIRCCCHLLYSSLLVVFLKSLRSDLLSFKTTSWVN